MKKINLLFLFVLGILLGNAQTTADFENLTLSADSYWDGSDLTGSFSSGHVNLANSYDTTYHSWSGFIYTNKGDDTTAGYGNQASAITAQGYYGSANYVIGNDYGNARVRLTGVAAGGVVSGTFITNATFPYLSMKDGDMFAKKFGGVSGNDPDWFKITAYGWLNGTLKATTAEFYLADYRFSDNSQDYIVNQWQWFDLRGLGNVDSFYFSLSSSDTGQFGMNTPAYFALDNIVTEDAANSAPVASSGAITITYSQDTLINVISNYVTNTAGGPLTVSVVGGPLLPGASAVVDSSNNIWYLPTTGVVANDTITYAVCNVDGQCDSAELVFNITGTTELSDLATATYSVFPNPVSDVLTIAHGSALQVIELYDITGKLVYSVKAANTPGQTQIYMGALAPGNYLLRLVSDKQVSVSKISKF